MRQPKSVIKLLLIIFSLQIAAGAAAQVENQLQTKPLSQPEPLLQPEPLQKGLLQVTYKQPELINGQLILFEAELLRLALDLTQKDFGPYQLNAIPPMNRARTLAALSQNTYPNLVLMLSYEDTLPDQLQLAYIPISLDRGAMSYRVCFMRDQIKLQIAQVKQLDQLKPYKFGAGIGWSDSKILRHNGLQVVEVDSVLSLFRMARAGRIDLFCRGISEYANELRYQQTSIGLTADDHLALFYPLPKFFFANSHSQVALHRIETGLRRALENGSFLEIWRKYHQQGIALSQLQRRTLIHLDNPLVKHLGDDYRKYEMNPFDNPSQR